MQRVDELHPGSIDWDLVKKIANNTLWGYESYNRLDLELVSVVCVWVGGWGWGLVKQIANNTLWGYESFKSLGLFFFCLFCFYVDSCEENWLQYFVRSWLFFNTLELFLCGTL
jgi:hypothetical protein